MSSRRRIVLELTPTECRALQRMLHLAESDVEADPDEFRRTVGRGAEKASITVGVKIRSAINNPKGEQ